MQTRFPWRTSYHSMPLRLHSARPMCQSQAPRSPAFPSFLPAVTTLVRHRASALVGDMKTAVIALEEPPNISVQSPCIDQDLSKITLYYASPPVLYFMYEGFDDPDQCPVQKWSSEISHSIAQRISIHFAGQVRFNRLCENSSRDS